MASDAGEVVIGGEEGIAVLTAGRGNQEIDGAGQHAFRTACRAELGGGDVSGAVQFQERKGFKELYESIALFVGSKPVQELLKNVADQENPVVRFEVCAKGVDVRM